MKIKINKEQQGELADFYLWISNCGDVWVKENQEYILVSISLLLNEKFRKSITSLKKQYVAMGNPVPKAEILSTCNDCGIEADIYEDTIQQYIKTGKIEPRPVIDDEDINYFGFKREYKYRSRIELAKKGKKPINDNYVGFIQFYSDTSPNQLKKFIDENADAIRQMRKILSPYPHSKRYGNFKRDMQIYLLSLLGCKVKEIDEKIKEQNQDDELFEGDIYQAIYDMERHVKNATTS